MKKIKANFFVLLLTAIFSLSSTVTPLFAFTIGEEREVGEKLLYSVRSAFKVLDDPDIAQYISQLGQSVLDVAGIQYFDYRFYVIDSKEFNAFAAPSGLIFFHSGLIRAMQSEDELVSVLAHEVGHIVKRHLASRVEKGRITTIGSLGLALAAVAFGGAAAPALLTGALATGQSFNLHYSRQHEEEADLLAYGWMKKMHRNPEGQVLMLESMRRIARYRSEKPPQYLLTHPNPEERLEYIQALLDNDRDELSGQLKATDNFAFIRFKYRIIAQSENSNDLKMYLTSISRDKRVTEKDRIMALYGLSQLAFNGNDGERSLALLEQVINYYPNKDVLLVDKGNIELSLGRMQQAEKTLKESLTQNSNDMYATYTLAKLFYRTGRVDDSEEYYLRVSYELPEYSKVYFDLGQIASDKKQYSQSSFYLGKFYLFQGKLKMAEKNLKNSLARGNLSEQMKKECDELLKKIKKLQK